jgi:hypothetical protein
MEEMPRKSAAELEAECLRLLAMDPHTRGIVLTFEAEDRVARDHADMDAFAVEYITVHNRPPIAKAALVGRR